MENLDYDVIICGGGPGGSTAALGFVDTNIRVAVIEKSSFPREKVCGDGIAGYVPKALNMISPRFGNAFKEFKAQFPITHVGINSFEGKASRVAFPESWFISPRYDLDNWLYQQASSLPNVTYFLQEQVTGVTIEEHAGTVTTDKGRTFTGKLIIGADGASSSVRRLLTDYKMDPAYHCAAVRAYYTGVTGNDGCTFEVYFIPKYPNGYFWIFPSTDNQVNIGFGLTSEEVSQRKIKLRELLLDIIEDTPALKKRFANATLVSDVKGWSIPFGYGKYPISGKRFMLIGDAASLADPSTGEGIGQAIVSGRIAAFHAKDCFEQNDFSAANMQAYDKEIHRKFGRIHLKRRFYWQVITHQKWILNLTIRLLNSTQFISGLIQKIIVRVAS
jgi:geranylgeranyl reductase family protein